MVFAGCPDDVQVIKKDEVANCDGLLLSPEASKQSDDAIQDAKYYKDLSGKLMDRRELHMEHVETLDKRLELYMNQSNVLAQELHKKEKDDKWENILYFGLGVLATGIAVYGAGQLD